MNKDVRHIRTANLRKILKERYDGNIAAMARATKMDRNQVRFILYPEKPGGRLVGEKLARKLEIELMLQAKQLDHDPNDESFPAEVDHELMNLVRRLTTDKRQAVIDIIRTIIAIQEPPT